MATREDLLATGRRPGLAWLLDAQAGGGVAGVLAACAAAEAEAPAAAAAWRLVAGAVRLGGHVAGGDPSSSRRSSPGASAGRPTRS